MIIFTDKDEILAAFKYYRKVGFPYPELTRYERIHIFRKLQKAKAKINKQRSSLFNNKIRVINVQSVGDVGLANYFHKHIWDSHAIGMRSPTQSFGIDKSLMKVFNLCIKFSGSISRKQVGIFIRTVNGTQMCSNFRPTAAKAVYDYFKKDDILDMSTGYGGRLLGFLASTCKGTYYGIDPSEKTCKNNRLIAKEYDSQHRVKIKCLPFEDVRKLPKVGLAFTSPPYFSKEIYDEGNPDQSRERYTTYKDWLKGFMKPMIERTKGALLPNGIIAINVGNIKIKNKQYPLVKDTVRIAKKNGLTLTEQLELYMPGFGRGLAKRKFEPILIFRKK